MFIMTSTRTVYIHSIKTKLRTPSNSLSSKSINLITSSISSFTTSLTLGSTRGKEKENSKGGDGGDKVNTPPPPATDSPASRFTPETTLDNREQIEIPSSIGNQPPLRYRLRFFSLEALVQSNRENSGEAGMSMDMSGPESLAPSYHSGIKGQPDKGTVLAEDHCPWNDTQIHNNIMAAGSRDRPPMLATRRYAQWRSRFLRYIDTRPNGDALRKCILKGPYTLTIVTTPAVPTT
ncbi:hypothetical protein Tco_1255792 [Tanacetum coccineum]